MLLEFIDICHSQPFILTLFQAISIASALLTNNVLRLFISKLRACQSQSICASSVNTHHRFILLLQSTVIALQLFNALPVTIHSTQPLFINEFQVNVLQ